MQSSLGDHTCLAGIVRGGHAGSLRIIPPPPTSPGISAIVDAHLKLMELTVQLVRNRYIAESVIARATCDSSLHGLLEPVGIHVCLSARLFGNLLHSAVLIVGRLQEACVVFAKARPFFRIPGCWGGRGRIRRAD